jgi:acyl carrier protein
MKTQEDLLTTVLDCANRVAGTSLRMPSDGDIPLEAFEFDSLSLLAFILELERACGIAFDDALLDYERLRSIRSTTALITLHRERDPSTRY